MPVPLHPGFDAYLDTLSITPKSRNNYRQYVRWIEKYAHDQIDLPLLRDAARIEKLIDQIGTGFDANPTSIRKHKFNPYLAIPVCHRM